MRQAKKMSKSARPMSPMSPKHDAPMSPRMCLPSGVSQSPKGDLGDHRNRELGAAFPRQIKRSGSDEPNPFTYRKPRVENDYGNSGAAL